jgi:signal transduction histidine kinase
VDRLLLDVGRAVADDRFPPDANTSHGNARLYDTVAALSRSARIFEEAMGVRQTELNDDGASLENLLVRLNSAGTMPAVADVVAAYCFNAFRACAAMMFVDSNGDLRSRFQWSSKNNHDLRRIMEVIRRPVQSVFRSGKPLFWPQVAVSGHNVSRHANHNRRLSFRSAAFLPVADAGQGLLGVLAMLFPQPGRPSGSTCASMVQFGQIVGGAMTRAQTFDDAIARLFLAEGAYRRQEEFLSMLSHELRNTMMPISGWAIALSSGSLPPDKQSTAIEAIVRNIRAMGYLVDDLFDLARISSGKLRLDVQEMRIQEVAREALAAIQHAVEIKRLRISTDISEAIPTFKADPRRVRQVLMNLLNNAVKFTPTGGSIVFKVIRQGNTAQCSVSDSGKGIKPEVLRYVFDRFWQEKGPQKAEASGLGLGLAIVREIVALHGGTIKARSHGPNRGATFIVNFPLASRKHHFSHAQTGSSGKRARAA